MKAKRKAIAPVVFCFLILLTLVDIGSPPFLAAQDIIVVESANPPAAEQGTVNLDVEIKGSGFGRGGAAKFFVSGTGFTDPGGIMVNSTTFKGPNRLIANITVASGATISKFDIQVSSSNGRIGKGIELFAVIEKGTGAVDKGDSERRLVRADFEDAATDRIRSDGFLGLPLEPFCGLDHPNGGLWDYWDPRDALARPEFCTIDGGEVNSNVSKGGRWFLFGHEQSAAENPPPPDPNRQRWLVFDFNDNVVDGVLSPCPDLDDKLYAGVGGVFPPINPDLCIDNLEFRIRADRVFKKGAKRQQLDIEIVLTTGDSFNAEFLLEYVNPLFILPHPVDPTAKILTTTGPIGGEDVSEAELLRKEEAAKGANWVPIGRFNMPFEVTVKRFCISGGEPVACR